MEAMTDRQKNIVEWAMEKDRLATLRDQFAAAALAGLTHPEDCQAGPLRMELVCKMAFAWADAMLATRR